MADKTKIEWADATVNAINGCSVKSPGCTNCYAMKQAHRFDARRGLTSMTNGGMVWTGEVRLNETALLQPLSWKRPRGIFWNAHGDTFHPNVPDEWIDKQFAVAALTPQHTHMILTKRSDRMRAWFAGQRDRAIARRCIDFLMTKHVKHGDAWPVRSIGDIDMPDDVELRTWPLPNVWLGVSVEDQTRADERIPDLLATHAAVRFLSCEPLLGPVDLVGPPHDSEFDYLGSGVGANIDWVIAGGESGPKARPSHPDWFRSLRDQCAAANVPFHFKQWGEWLPAREEELPEHFGRKCDRFRVMCSNGFVGPVSLESVFLHKPAQFPGCFPSGADGDCTCAVANMQRVGKQQAGRRLDGVIHDAMPGQPNGNPVTATSLGMEGSTQ